MTFSWQSAPKHTFNGILTAILFLFLISPNTIKAQGSVDEAMWKDGKALFKSNCQSCHLPDKKMTGPALEGADKRWADTGDYQGKSGKEWLYEWVRNWEAPVKAGMPYAVEMQNFDASAMQLNPTLTDADIDKIFYYADNSTYKIGGGETPGGETQVAGSTFPIKTFLWIVVLGLLFLFLILWRVFALLGRMNAEKAGSPLPEPTPFWKSKKFISLVAILAVVLLAYVTASNAISLGRQQNYQPTQPINYSHATHAGKLNIQCQYCHSGAADSKHSNIPSASVCMNCHKNVQEGPKTGRKEIAKIYSAIGYNPNEGKYFAKDTKADVVKAELEKYLKQDYAEGGVDKKELESNVEAASEMYNKPIEWVRIHNLPDHVYFNHSQHVTAGKVECQTCHGNIQEMEVVKQHAPLSMGWCINCHRETSVDFGNNYYQSYEKFHEKLKSGEMDKVTVEDIGGTECQKCHY